MGYIFDAQQQAVITKLKAQEHDFLSLFQKGEGLNQTFFNNRLNEIQGAISYLMENTSIYFGNQEPLDPSLATFWVRPLDGMLRIYDTVSMSYTPINTALHFGETNPPDPSVAVFWVRPSDGALRIYDANTGRYTVVNGQIVNNYASREFSSSVNSSSFETLFIIPDLATPTEMTSVNLTIVNQESNVGVVRIIYIPSDKILQEEEIPAGATVLLNLGNVYNIKIMGKGIMSTSLRMTVNNSIQ